MRRVFALLLLSAIVFWLETPLLAGGAQEQLPACCRINGRHKCMMRMAANPADPQAPSMAAKCPFPFQADLSAVNGHAAALPLASLSSSEPLANPRTAQTQEEALFRISFARSRQKRGPPSFLLA